jgi:hypothetical protein
VEVDVNYCQRLLQQIKGSEKQVEDALQVEQERHGRAAFQGQRSHAVEKPG